MKIETRPETTTAFARWEAGELSAAAAATAIVQELISEIEPEEQALEVRKKARRAQVGTLLIRVGESLEVLGRITRWVEPITTEAANVKKLRSSAMSCAIRALRSWAALLNVSKRALPRASAEAIRC